MCEHCTNRKGNKTIPVRYAVRYVFFHFCIFTKCIYINKQRFFFFVGIRWIQWGTHPESAFVYAMLSLWAQSKTHHCTTGAKKWKHHVESVRLPCSSIKPLMWANTNDDWIVFKFSCSFEYLAGIKTGLKHMRLVYTNERERTKNLNKTTVAPVHHQFSCKTLLFAKVPFSVCERDIKALHKYTKVLWNVNSM